MIQDLRKVGPGVYKEVLVLLPYRAQKERMIKALNVELLQFDVRVSTIDSCQGSEADAVFLGLVKTQV